MITKETIMEAYLFMRKENQSVPSETLEFMRDTALAELEKSRVKNLPMHSVSVRDFECGDVVCTNDGKMWVITEIEGEDVYVTGNGKRDCQLEKSDITHAH